MSDKELKEDDLVSKLLPDPSKSPKIKLLIGFLGKDDRQGFWRLYLDLTLTEYFEINRNDIIHSHSFKSELSPLGGTMLWVNKDAEVLHVRPVSKQIQNQFLSGDITSEFLPQTGLSALLGSATGRAQFINLLNLMGGTTLITVIITIRLSLICLNDPNPPGK